MTYAPIALFTYNRANHTRTAVESLLRNAEAKDSDLFIFSDGAKTPEKQKGVDENREYIHTISGFKSITIIEREKNWGLANSLIAGITEIVNKFGSVIVVEDDLILSPYFLQYMNEALEKYKNDDRVACIGSFLDPVKCKVPNTFFTKCFFCWGWATWKRAWDIFEPDTNKLLKQLRWKCSKFNVDNSHNYYGMLYCQKVGLVDSWAIRFYASFFLHGMLQLLPGKTLSIQSGTDGSGVHCTSRDTKFDSMKLHTEPIELADIPVNENMEFRRAYSSFLKKMLSDSILTQNYNSFKSFVRRLCGIDYR